MGSKKKLTVGLSLGLVLVACGDFAGITDVPPGGPGVVPDTAAPTIELGDVEDRLEVGSVLSATIADDYALGAAYSVLVEPDSRVVLWHSDTLDLRDLRVDEVEVEWKVLDLDEDFPFGEEVEWLVGARDSVGKVRWVGTPEDSAAVFRKAEGKIVTFFKGQTFNLPEGSQIGDFEIDPDNRKIYFTNTPFNYVGGIDLDTRVVEDWRAHVGSQPDVMAFQPYGWGGGPRLAVGNSGGTEISIVAITSSGGEEVERIVIPALTMFIEEDEIPLRRQINSMVVQCPTELCDNPTLYVGSPELGDPESRSAVRSFSLRGFTPTYEQDVLTPRYTGIPEEDESVTVRVKDRDEGELFTRSDVSRCGTLALGAVTIERTPEIGGPLYVVEDGEAGGTCGDADRILKFEYVDGAYEVAAAALANIVFEDRVESIEDIDVSGEMAGEERRVLVLGDAEVFLLYDDLRLEATIPSEGANAVAFLRDLEGRTLFSEREKIFAVATSETIDIYEMEHYTLIHQFDVATEIAGEVSFFKMNNFGDVGIVGLNSDGTAMWMLESSLDEIWSEAN